MHPHYYNVGDNIYIVQVVSLTHLASLRPASLFVEVSFCLSIVISCCLRHLITPYSLVFCVMFTRLFVVIHAFLSVGCTSTIAGWSALCLLHTLILFCVVSSIKGSNICYRFYQRSWVLFNIRFCFLKEKRNMHCILSYCTQI